MQKKIIALAIAAAISAPAFADTSNVTVYGQVNMSYDMMNVGSGHAYNAPATAVTSQSVNRIGSNTSRLGLKGSEDLGDGLAAIWQIEMQIDPGQGTAPAANSANVIGGRNTFGGLKSDSLGTVLLGRHDTPYKLSTRAYDVFGDGIADNRMLMGAVAGKSAVLAFDGRQDQVIAYISPAFSGFTVAAAYLNVNPGAAGVATGGAKQSAASLAGMYNDNGLSASLAYEVHTLDTGIAAVAATAATATAPAIAARTANTGYNEKATKLGLGYKQDAYMVGFAYEKTSDNTGTLGANQFGHNAYYLSGKYNVTASDAVKLAYTKMGVVGAAGVANGAKAITIGYDHTMSKRTTIYALYSKLTNDTNGTYGFSTNGTSGVVGVVGAGTAPSVFSLGMRHTF
jgi:predicted porin